MFTSGRFRCFFVFFEVVWSDLMLRVKCDAIAALNNNLVLRLVMSIIYIIGGIL